MNKKEVRKHILSIICVSTFLIFMTTFVYLPKQENLLSSFAFLEAQRSFYVEELSSGILLHDATPVSDKKGLQNDPYTFKVVNNSNKEITYQIKFNNNEEKIKAQGKEVLPNRYLRYNLLQGNTEIVEPSTLPDDGILYEAVIPANSEIIFNFRMWLDYNADNGAMNKTFIGKIEVEKNEK